MWVLKLSHHPVIQRSVVLELQSTDGMRDALDGILYRMCKVIHRINAPLVSCIVVCHMRHTVENGISHIQIGRRDVNARAEYLLTICVLSVLHLLKKLQILLHGTAAKRIFFARLCKSTSVFLNLLCGQVRHICLSFPNQLHCALVHLVKIVRGKKQPVLPVRAKPFDIRLDRLHKLDVLLGRIRVVKTHVELAAVFFCDSIIDKNRLGMTNVQIAVWLRRKARMYRIIYTLCQILVNHLFDKVSRSFNCIFFCVTHFQILLIELSKLSIIT